MPTSGALDRVAEKLNVPFFEVLLSVSCMCIICLQIVNRPWLLEEHLRQYGHFAGTNRMEIFWKPNGCR